MTSPDPTKLRRGRLVAEFLAGSWRQRDLPPLTLDEPALDEITPLINGCGGAALGWKRVAQTELKNSASAELLHQAYRLHSLQAAVHEEKLGKVFRHLNDAGIDAILAKGWLAASLYSDAALRPYGDIDVCVRPGQFKQAEQILSEPEMRDCFVDLHRKFFEITDRKFDELLSRARVTQLQGTQIRMLGQEDHLALLCIHLLKHGAWRPTWLCDIGVAMESLPANFDWGICFGSDNTRRNWIECAIGLARELLQARTPGFESVRIPAWMLKDVLVEWSHPFAMDQAPLTHAVPITELWRQPAQLIDGLRNRWPNAIIATVSVHGKFNELPRWPYQVANWALRGTRLLNPEPAND